MKHFYVKLLIMLSFFGLVAFIPDHFLMPENFYLHKGDKFNLHLLTGENLIKEREVPYTTSQTTKFMIYEGSKKTDLSKITKNDALPLLNYNLQDDGLVMVEMNTNELNEIPREDFIPYLTEQGYDEIADKLKNSNALNFTEKYNRYLKTLITVDEPRGNAYEKVLGDDFEIILKHNPYKLNYGDGLTGQVFFKGKPFTGQVMLYIKTASGNVYPQKFTSDASGKVYFSVTREGIYLLRATRFEASKGKDADYESWVASYTFAFSNHNDEPNTYKEFGFGDKH
ncbi:DUF4198 domain-containing protein [Mucilaginibacter sp. AK015]|uniref:DUF4198 domain-containing protein n=1 Tax=Mucilaginibacter sp. AK015 TaxID=2723072 RepID=UPI0016092262|nr:DUF4198 domain-containing protein [Mucilaginibacter sp. AK015]MBB5396818.1 putative GH25 family protein [Mucilaginibacter sp. AK015]